MKPTYFPIQKHWRKLGPIFKSAEAKSIWLPCMKEYVYSRALEHKYKAKPKRDYECPAALDSCDWRWCRFDRKTNKIGPHPAFWDFVCHSACHWVVDLCLYVARKAYPKVPWQIMTSDKHSTVWNGDTKRPVMFDVNFLALEVSAKECWQLASKGRKLKPGKWLKPWNVPDRVRRYL